MSELLDKLDESIKMVLNECDGQEMPNVCALRSTPEGVESIIVMVRKRVIQQRFGILEALRDIEAEFTEI
jgi:hypothetical protein